MRSHLLFIALVVFANMPSLAPASASSIASADLLRETRSAWVAALQSANIEKIAGYVAADFSAVLDAGDPLNRNAFLSTLRSKALDPSDFAFETTPKQIRSWDGAAIIAGQGTRLVTSRERAFVREVRRSTGRSFLRETLVDAEEERAVQFSEIWAWHQGRWQLIHLQWTAGPAE
jgi:hypothetical protein